MAQIQNIYDVLLQPHQDEINEINECIGVWFALIIVAHICAIIIKYYNNIFSNEMAYVKYLYADEKDHADAASSGINVLVVVVGKLQLELETAFLVYAVSIVWFEKSRSAKMILFKITVFGVIFLSSFSEVVIMLSLVSSERRISLADIFLAEKYGASFCRRSNDSILFESYLGLKSMVFFSAGSVVWVELRWWIYVIRNAPGWYRWQATFAPALAA
ncbi:uncharacterized protein LOC135837441 [Planococcus citri]|uniref:uncharacterized protein LOC135837441 n=1 Tax=Planococcus citri TaxID=170843 RepID=UPI0031F77B86